VNPIPQHEDEEALARLRKELNRGIGCSDPVPYEPYEPYEPYRGEIAQRLYWINQAHP
jgi:hypothetical protein